MTLHERLERTKTSVAVLALVAIAAAAAGCGEVGSGPNAPAAIELQPLNAYAPVVGDSLRDVDGVAVPLHAIVRNLKGDIIPDAPVRYTYADATRDTAIFVDSITGYIVALKPLALSTPTARIAARVGNSLQIIRTIAVALRPDSADRGGISSVTTMIVSPPDTGAAGVAANTSAGLGVYVRHIAGDTVSVVPNFLVKFQLIRPANPNNDSTKSVFLVDDQSRTSNIDTTDGSGLVSRYVRVRASQFPTSDLLDSAVVLVNVTYRGKSVKGAPIKIVVPIQQKPKN
ncbi:MAG: hypothetical protein ABJC26_14980 [Gemmatimonadaceae bacterium]